MNKSRKPLNEIINKFNSTEETPMISTEKLEPVLVETSLPTDSLTAQLANPKKKTTKIRFTLDLEKHLDDRLNKSAKYLNRSKADLARIAIERLLDELEQER